MLKRLRQLEEENTRLRNATKANTDATLTVTEGDYKGHPTLTFERSVPQFYTWFKKLSVIRRGHIGRGVSKTPCQRIIGPEHCQ